MDVGDEVAAEPERGTGGEHRAEGGEFEGAKVRDEGADFREGEPAGKDAQARVVGGCEAHAAELAARGGRAVEEADFFEAARFARAEIVVGCHLREEVILRAQEVHLVGEVRGVRVEVDEPERRAIFQNDNEIRIIDDEDVLLCLEAREIDGGALLDPFRAAADDRDKAVGRARNFYRGAGVSRGAVAGIAVFFRCVAEVGGVISVFCFVR